MSLKYQPVGQLSDNSTPYVALKAGQQLSDALGGFRDAVQGNFKGIEQQATENALDSILSTQNLDQIDSLNQDELLGNAWLGQASKKELLNQRDSRRSDLMDNYIGDTITQRLANSEGQLVNPANASQALMADIIGKQGSMEQAAGAANQLNSILAPKYAQQTANISRQEATQKYGLNPADYSPEEYSQAVYDNALQKYQGDSQLANKLAQQAQSYYQSASQLSPVAQARLQASIQQGNTSLDSERDTKIAEMTEDAFKKYGDFNIDYINGFKGPKSDTYVDNDSNFRDLMQTIFSGASGDIDFETSRENFSKTYEDLVKAVGGDKSLITRNMLIEVASKGADWADIIGADNEYLPGEDVDAEVAKIRKLHTPEGRKYTSELLRRKAEVDSKHQIASTALIQNLSDVHSRHSQNNNFTGNNAALPADVVNNILDNSRTGYSKAITPFIPQTKGGGVGDTTENSSKYQPVTLMGSQKPSSNVTDNSNLFRNTSNPSNVDVQSIERMLGRL